MPEELKPISIKDLAQMFPIPDGVRLSATLFARSDDDLPIEGAQLAIVDVGVDAMNILHINQFESFISKLLVSLQDVYGKKFRQMNNQEVSWAENQMSIEEENEKTTT